MEARAWSRRSRWLGTLSLVLATAACGPDRGSTAAARQRLIVDQAHDASVAGFWFLPPMVPAPAVQGTFEPGYSPTVRIEELDGAGAVSRVLATYTTTTGAGSETVRVDPAGQTYIVNWHTDAFGLDPASTYRISVVLDGRVVGLADVDVGASQAELRNVATGEYVPLLDGRTLPIKFWMNRCAPVVCSAIDACHDPGVCQPETGLCTTPEKPGGCGDPCAVDNGGCDANAKCTAGSGTVACECIQGFTGDGTTCADVDECASGTALCSVHATCTNAAGSYSCACGAGFDGDGLTCQDVDECAAGTAGCDPNATCENIPGWATCTCNAGWAGDGRTCADVDECYDGTAICGGAYATCINTPGSYGCVCLEGYGGDGWTCVDLDECSSGGAGCDANATCENTAGSFVCTCNAGFSGDGKTCADVDECASNACGPGVECTNTAGSYTCGCASGHVACAGGCCVEDATSITAGSLQACSLTSAGTVRCWGSGNFGALGTGSTTASHRPVEVAGMGSGVRAVSTGLERSCALLADGTVKCWGLNNNGGIGDGTYYDAYVPAAVLGVSDAVEVAVGYQHACARLATGAATCWGGNTYGQLGNGSYLGSATPAAVQGLPPVVSIAADFYNTCAVTTAGELYCWGYNISGQIGDGTTTNRTLPVRVIAGGVQAVASGLRHTCALMVGGTVECWGSNTSGQLGDGTTLAKRLPADVPGLSGVTQLASGASHSCAIANGALQCWGLNGNGQLGDGTNVLKRSPTPVPGLPDGPVAADLGESFSCALLSSGRVQCWGANGSGQLGDGTTVERWTPAQVIWP